jgi:integrase
MNGRATQLEGRSKWSYSAGERGRNRVRVFAWPELGENLWLDYQEDGKRVRRNLGHSDRSRAKRQADELAGRFARHDVRPAVITLRTLFDMYEREVTKHKGSESARAHDRRTLPMFVEAFGKDRRPETLNVRDWESFIRLRQSGHLAPRPVYDDRGKVVFKPVRARVIEQDLSLLQAVLNWSERARADGSGYLLDRNPLRGLKKPREDSPRRPMLTVEQFVALRTAAEKHSAAAERFVLLAWFTGHRSGAIRQLRWSDIDLEAGVISWRADSDKIGYEHKNPLHPDLAAFLKRDRIRCAAIGDAFLFPSETDAELPMPREYAVKNLWPAIRDAAGIPKGQKYGWHSFRRAFANQLRDVPLRELKDLGGWKSQNTVIAVYLQPSESAQRTALKQIAAG